MANPNDYLEFVHTGGYTRLKPWTYTWKYIYDIMVQCNDFYLLGAGLALPTPVECRTQAVETFTWYHLCPMIGFVVSRSGSTISIVPEPNDHFSTAYPYGDVIGKYSPTITFFYKNNAGALVAIGSFGTEAEYRDTAHPKTVTVNGMSQVDIYVDCGHQNCVLFRNTTFVGTVKLHSHVGNPAAPTVTASTGKTLTVSNGADGIQCTTTTSGWYGSPYTFTGFSQGSTYYFRCRKYCDGYLNDPAHVFYSTKVSGTTWKISGSVVNISTGAITYKATHVAGTGTITAANKTITYELYTTKSTSATLIATKTGNNGSSVTFIGLESGKTYYCYAYTTDLGNGDNNCWIDGGYTKEELTVEGSSGNVSATTLRASVSWKSGGASSVICSITCNGVHKTLSTSGGYVGFTGLTPGTKYTVNYSVVATYIYNITENGQAVTKTEESEVTGSLTLTTKKATFVDPVNISTKIIQYKSSSNNTSDTMQHKLNSNGSWSSVAQNTYKIYNNLKHNTQYTIYARINGCYAYNTSGSITSTNDSEISKVVNTLPLSLSVSIVEQHQNSIITLWQAYVNGIATDKDSIDNTKFSFSYMDTLAKKADGPYQSSNIIEGSDGETTGDYQLDKKIYSNNLTWVYCEYIVKASITDGYNVVSNEIVCHSIFPPVYIHSNGQWHKYIPYIYINGEYVPAMAYAYNNNKYNEMNGE